MITRDAITRAAARIANHLRRTPVVSVTVEGVELPVTLKLELLQHAGSFKSRGAFNTLLQASVGAGGVATASGGNHGAAVAYASRQLGHRAKIFVPEISSPAKVARIASYGAEVVQKGANYSEALALCEAWIATSGATGVHAYDAEATLEGQGTLGRELEAQAPGIDTLLVAVAPRLQRRQFKQTRRQLECQLRRRLQVMRARGSASEVGASRCRVQHKTHDLADTALQSG